jgi:hypothetical protein
MKTPAIAAPDGALCAFIKKNVVMVIALAAAIVTTAIVRA